MNHRITRKFQFAFALHSQFENTENCNNGKNTQRKSHVGNYLLESAR